MTNNPPDTTATRRSAYRRRLDAVLAYIDAHLDGNLTLQQLSKVANSSPFRFHRQFHAHTGFSVGRYVRLKRLHRAAHDLVFAADKSILEMALAAGFGSPEAFARAFRREYGCAPSAFRKAPEWRRDAVPELTDDDGAKMDKQVEIVDFPTTRVAAVEYQGPEPRSLSATMQLVAWRREVGVGPDQGMTLGVHYSDPRTTPPEEFRLDICVSYDGDVLPNAHGVVAKVVPGGRCARMRHAGSRNWMPQPDYLYREWLPESGERLRDYPLFFHYVNVGPDVRDEDMITDIYLPIV